MNTLKQVIHYPDTNSVEATWVDSGDVTIKCHSYADVQMQMFRDDVVEFGGDITEYEELIALVESNIKPVEPEPIHAPQIVSKAQGIAAMIEAGLWPSVKAYFSTEASEVEQDLFGAITEFNRQSPLLATLKDRFELTDGMVDNLFALAASKVI